MDKHGMWVQVYRESGWEEAMRAMRLSRGSQHLSDTLCDDLGPEDQRLINRLLRADEDAEGQPHTVALRQVVYWIGARMPLYWWKHMDRYSVGKDQASASTMYGLMQQNLTQDDFSGKISVAMLWYLNWHIGRGHFDIVNRHLPLSYLQERSMMISHPTLHRIIQQRYGHKLSEWFYFIKQVLFQVRYPHLLLYEYRGDRRQDGGLSPSK